MMLEIDESVALLGDSFGNWMLRESVPIALPNSISYWPQTLGWFILSLLLAIFVIRYLQRRLQHYWRNRYRKQYCLKLSLLDIKDRQATPRAIHQLLQQACLVASPDYLSKHKAARLHGDDFISFLDTASRGQTEFTADFGATWQQALYLPIARSKWSVAQNQLLVLLAQRWLILHMEQGEFDD